MDNADSLTRPVLADRGRGLRVQPGRGVRGSQRLDNDSRCDFSHLRRRLRMVWSMRRARGMTSGRGEVSGSGGRATPTPSRTLGLPRTWTRLVSANPVARDTRRQSAGGSRTQDDDTPGTQNQYRGRRAGGMRPPEQETTWVTRSLLRTQTPTRIYTLTYVAERQLDCRALFSDNTGTHVLRTRTIRVDRSQLASPGTKLDFETQDHLHGDDHGRRTPSASPFHHRRDHHGQLTWTKRRRKSSEGGLVR